MEDVKINDLPHPTQRTHIVIVPNEDSAIKNKLVKKSIENEYKNVFNKVLVYRDTQIDKNFGRGISAVGIELRTILPIKKQELVNTLMCGGLSFFNRNRFEESKSGEVT